MTNGTPDVWGECSGGGAGERLREFVREYLGSERPKQFCAFVRQRTMLEHAVHRTAMLIPRTRVVVAATAHHRRYVEECLGPRVTRTRPAPARSAGPGPWHPSPLAQVLHRDPHAVVAVLPSDHFIQLGWRFMQAVAEAVRYLTLRSCERVVLLAVASTDPEPEYGWQNPGAPLRDSGADALLDVAQFRENRRMITPAG